jgi:ABC-type glycerol-3-phosphate transport system substrate-binding protein
MKVTPFQYVIMGIFVALLVGGVVIFAVFGGKGNSNSVGSVVVWGTMDATTMQSSIAALIGVDQNFQQVSYVQKRPETYEADLINAFASNRAPDLFFLNDAQILAFKDKVLPISYNIISQRTFNDTFVNEASLLAFPSGIVGLPVYIDPLVMYWNKDLFAGANVATYPRAWSELTTIVPKMTALDTASNVKRSAVALGSYDNVRYAKEILAALLLQLNNPIVGTDAANKYTSLLAGNQTSGVDTSAQAVVRFYTGFSNSSQSIYSWNRALPNSLNAFTSGDVGMYFGLASDYQVILARNPNLAVSVALLPQASSVKSPVTYGRMTALAIPRNAKNQSGALYIAQIMAGAQGASALSQSIGLPSARRDLLTAQPADAAASVFAQSALISRGWYDPGAGISGPIFKSMVESVVSGKAQLGDAVQIASMQLTDSLVNFNTQ